MKTTGVLNVFCSAHSRSTDAINGRSFRPSIFTIQIKQVSAGIYIFNAKESLSDYTIPVNKSVHTWHVLNMTFSL